MSNFQDIESGLLDRQLNLEKIFKMGDSDKEIIMSMFNDLVDSFYGERGLNLPGGYKIDYMRASVLYNTLLDNDYLVTRREKNLDNILN